MVKKTTPSAEQPQPDLTIPRNDAESQIQERISKGKEILTDFGDQAKRAETCDKANKWIEYNEEMIARIFTNDRFAKEYKRKSLPPVLMVGMPITPIDEKVKGGIAALESILERLPIIPEDSSVKHTKSEKTASSWSSMLHPKIEAECVNLVKDGYFGEATEKSFKIVRDRLRTLTGHETSSEAFGKGHLFIKGASASNVEHDFQEAVKFLGMALDKFRNEKSHTATANITDENRAYQYLAMSSLMLQHLDNGEIRQSP
ncbi:TIGR02391 family protein [Candidatus Saccharibacteria bacterium]|nr:TIGR02391 family protein [Candidatus Saccharibacteria bacterium]